MTMLHRRMPMTGALFARLPVGPESYVAATPAVDVIYESEHVRVLHQRAASDTVFVTFNESGMGVDGFSYWGDGVFAPAGHGAIGVVSFRPNWFPQDLDMVAAIRRAISSAGYDRVVAYGHSQGGYGALKYSRALGASTVIASCPQWSIAPADVAAFDTRFVANYVPALHDDMRIAASEISNNAYLLFDPHSLEDATHAARIAVASSIEPIVLPFTAHDGIRFATATGVAKALVGGLSGTVLETNEARPRQYFPREVPAEQTGESCRLRARAARRLVRGARRDYPGYWINRASAFAGRLDWERNVRVSLERAAVIGASSASALADVAHLHIGRGEVEAARSRLDRALGCIDPRLTHVVLRIWSGFHRIGAAPAALDLLRAATVASPTDAFLRLHLVTTLLEVRNAAGQEAAREVAAAAPYVGDSLMMWKHVENACNQLGLDDGAREASLRMAALDADATSAAGTDQMAIKKKADHGR